MATNRLPSDYDERVYAGWLGKCIGVRFGAPLENWTYEEIRDHLGELTGYVTEDGGKIFKPDDDTAVPMLKVRALEDYGYPAELTPEQCGDTMLNYIADGHGTLWWGGYGISSEETGYINLKHGIQAPLSGSIAMNGATIAEQIGGQIFANIWGLVAPGQPARAADMSAASSSVTHAGDGINGGRFVAAMTAAAFSEHDPRRLIEVGLEYVPPDSEYARVVRAMLGYHADHPHDWRAAFAHLQAHFGYDKYSGVVHIIPNAGVIALGLLYGEGDFSKTLQITNMCGWDTDCNVGNVGAILGVMVGVAGIAPHWRERINDLVIAASLIGTRNILTVSQCADVFGTAARRLLGMDAPQRPRLHFQYPTATQNFVAEGEKGRPIHVQQTVLSDGTPALQVAVRKLNKKGEIRIYTRTYYRPSELSGNYYGAAFTPLIFPGQTLSAELYLPADAPPDVKAGLFAYDDNHDTTYQAEGTPLTPGQWHTLSYEIPSRSDVCLSRVGITLRNVGALWEVGSLALRWMDWGGTADYQTTFAHEREETGGISQWTYLRGSWRLENGAYHGSGPYENETYTGDIDWGDSNIRVEVTPLMGEHHRVNLRVQGALRCYAFGLSVGDTVTIYKKDRTYRAVASARFAWEAGRAYVLGFAASGNQLTASVTGEDASQEITWTDDERPYLSGQVGLSNVNGHTRYENVTVSAVMKG